MSRLTNMNFSKSKPNYGLSKIVYNKHQNTRHHIKGNIKIPGFYKSNIWLVQSIMWLKMSKYWTGKDVDVLVWYSSRDLINGPFNNWTCFNHLNTGLVLIFFLCTACFVFLKNVQLEIFSARSRQRGTPRTYTVGIRIMD